MPECKAVPMKRMAPPIPDIVRQPSMAKFDWPTWDDKPETERYIHQKPVASVSPLPNQTSQSEDAEHAVALYDFEAQQEDELSFEAGDHLLVMTRCDQDWLYGCTVKNSKFGIFPSSFVHLGSESGSETESLKEIDGTNVCDDLKADLKQTKVTKAQEDDGRPVVAIFSFAPEQDGDLGFEEGETIYVLSRINKDWLMGRNAKGETGQFPAGFIQLGELHNSSVSKVSSESGVYVCLYDFEAQQTDDLTIRAGDKIRVTEKVSEEWWQGHVLGESNEGIFPANFVEPL